MFSRGLKNRGYDELRNDTTEDEHVRDLTMRSLKETINQFKEEIARYEAHQPARLNPAATTRQAAS